jgi:hypothetical protein
MQWWRFSAILFFPIDLGTAPHNITAYDQPLLVVGCPCRLALCTHQGMRLGCAKGQLIVFVVSHQHSTSIL